MEMEQMEMQETFPPLQGVLSEVTALYQPYVEKLFSDDKVRVAEGLKQIKNFVIGNNKQKTNFIVLGAIPRLVYLIQHEQSDIYTKTQCAVLLGSLAKGMEANVKSLLDYNVMDVMFYGLRHTDLKFYEACLRCIRTIVTSSEQTGKLIFVDVSLMARMLACINKSLCTQECTCEVISHCCTMHSQQDLLYDLGVVGHLTPLLVSEVTRVRLKAVHAIAVLCYKNINICCSLLKMKAGNVNVIDVLTEMLSRAQPVSIQIHAARCLTYIYRSGAMNGLDNKIICKKVLPCLVRMCSTNCGIDERVLGAKTVAYLMEADPSLQRLALICEQFPRKLEAYFRYPIVADTQNVDDMRRFKQELGRGNDLLEAVFLAYASLLSNDEDMRKLVANDLLVQRLVEGLANTYQAVRTASLECLLSLSRSVQILRTVFEDLEVWKPILKIAQSQCDLDDAASVKEHVAASAVVSNLLLEFSPNKSRLLSSKILDTVKSWCETESSNNLRRNGVWSLLNLTFQADLPLKMEVMSLLRVDLLFALLTSVDYDVIAKTLGILNNVLTTKEHTDQVMALHGDTVMQACAIAIESTSLPQPTLMTSLGGMTSHGGVGDVASSVHTAALCVLGCVASGDGGTTVKKYWNDNENLMRRLVQFLGSSDRALQTAAVACVTSLCRIEERDSSERRRQLAELGAAEALNQLRNSTDEPLFNKVKSALQLFQPKGSL